MSRAARSAFVRPGRGGIAQLVVARPLLDELDDLELRAVLAHEVSHLTAGDLERLRRRMKVLIGASAVSAFAVVFLTAGDDVAFPVYVAWMFVGLVVGIVLMSLLQRPLEVRADAGAVRLTGDPEHLATALEKSSALSVEVRRQILAGPWRWLLLPFAWKVPSHPKVQDRADRIRGLASSSEPASG
jgi:heat shock protein HtpX